MKTSSLVHFCLCGCAGYKVIKKIGEGTFSEVLKTQSLKDGKFYACKTMKQTINRYVFCNSCPPYVTTLSAVFRTLKLEAAADEVTTDEM